MATFVVFHLAHDGSRYAINPNHVQAFFPAPPDKTKETRICFVGEDMVDVRESYGEVWEALDGAIGS